MNLKMQMMLEEAEVVELRPLLTLVEKRRATTEKERATTKINQTKAITEKEIQAKKKRKLNLKKKRRKRKERRLSTKS